MQKIVPFLWFNDQAEEAMRFYVAAFATGEIGKVTKQGEKVFSVTFTLAGREFYALNGGPHYKITPAISFFVECPTAAEVDALWAKLIDGGMAAMPLQKYPFSEKFGWVIDRFGVSWQVMLAAEAGAPAQKISPCLMYVGAQNGKAQDAMQLYTSLFPNSKIETVAKYASGEPGTEGTIKQASFTLAGQAFRAMDSSAPHQFTFTPGTSLFVNCKDQPEVDRLWAALLADGGKESRCGWLTDKFGVSWQIIPEALGRLMGDPDREKAGRVVQAMMKMVKIEVKGLEEAYMNK